MTAGRHRTALQRWLLTGVALVIAAGTAFVLTRCTPAQTQAAHTSIVSAGSAVATLHRAHQQAFDDASDALRTRLRASGGTLEDYERQAAPLEATFRARSALLQELAAAVYSAAAVNDAVRRGASAADYRAAATQLVTALEGALALLRDGRVLPALAVPPQMDQALAALRQVAGGTHARE